MVFMCSFLLRFIKKNFWNAAQMQIRTWFVPHTGQRSTIWNQIPYNGLFSSFLLRLFRKVSDMLRKCKYELYCPKVVRKIVRRFNVLPLYDDFLGFLCMHDQIWSFVPLKVQLLCFIPQRSTFFISSLPQISVTLHPCKIYAVVVVLFPD